MYKDRRMKKEEKEKEVQQKKPDNNTFTGYKKNDSYKKPSTSTYNKEMNPSKKNTVSAPEDNKPNSKYYSNKKNTNTNNNTNMSDNIYKTKSKDIEESKETSDFTVNKKLRNTMTGLNNSKMRYESGLIDMILKVEKDNVNHYLRGDLAEMYNDINRVNHKFKNDIFLANVDNFEKKTGILDKKPIIPYNCSEDISFKLDSFPKTDEIIDKFAERIKYFKESD